MRLTIFIALVALQAVGALAAILMIGKKRDPTTPGAAVAQVILCGLFVAGLYVLYR